MNLLPYTDSSPHALLGIYLNDHLMGATSGVKLSRRMASHQSEPANRAVLTRLSYEIAEDRETLIALMRQLDVKVQTHRVVAGWVGERLGRLKLNGTLLTRSPLSDLLELEAMRLGVEGKRCLWRILQRVATADRRISATEMETLEQRALGQIEELESIRLEAAEALRP